MKLLLDENLPKGLKQHFPEHEIYTVRDMGWQGKKNGELLMLMMADNFNVLITFDKNLRHQQNFAKYPIAVLVLNAWGNSMPFLEPLLPQMRETLSRSLPTGATVVSLS
ncbi:hypothetical protein EXU85_03075 [Spirosoma sp. KCTC 42546]|uniref:DUF5615 family PIN-like protein n=1 Tax=Spirosoma sp. KCTC 42546 TaxID=2520506 RepID=UPI0011578C24|nr:DUF5615 family PIN-like protein [Spirosoma sp. KCTC 42546]QDK77628.1 hypothetical protein EXU85_03075 [Spirosoma sp. KCTC 42546]